MIKSKKFRYIVIPLLCITLILNTFVLSVQPAKANPAIAIGAPVIVGGLLVAMGYSYLTTGDVTTVFNGLPQAIKTKIEEYTAFEFATSPLAVGSVVVAGEVVDYFNQNYSSGVLPSGATKIEGFETTNARWYFETVVTDIGIENASRLGNAIGICVDTNNIQYNMGSINAFYGVMDSLESSTIAIHTSANSSYELSKTWDIGSTHTTTIEGATTNSTGDIFTISKGSDYGYRILFTNKSIPIYTNIAKTQILGYIGTVPASIYEFKNAISNMKQDSNGDYSITMPYTSTPTTNNDAPDVLGLETVLAGIDDLDAYFAGGGVITLSDGTVIGGSTGTNDISNTDIQALQDSMVGEMSLVEKALSGIKSLVGSMSLGITGLLSNIWEWIQDFGTTITGYWTTFWDWCGELVTNIGIAIVDALVKFFGMPTGFGLDLFNDFRGRFSPAFDQFLDKLQFTFSDSTLDDIEGTVTVGGVSSSGTIVNFDGLREYLPIFKAWFAGLIYFLLAWYNIKQFQHLIYGTAGMPGNMSVDIQTTNPTQTDLTHYNGIGGKK